MAASSCITAAENAVRCPTLRPMHHIASLYPPGGQFRFHSITVSCRRHCEEGRRSNLVKPLPYYLDCFVPRNDAKRVQGEAHEIPLSGNGVEESFYMRRQEELTNRKRHKPPLATKTPNSVPAGNPFRSHKYFKKGKKPFDNCFLSLILKRFFDNYQP